MGDRSNIGFRDRYNNVIVLYGHWLGEENVLSALKKALEASRPRWNDESYATRIAISNIVGDNWKSETGWGLSVNQVLDNDADYVIPVVDFLNQKIEIHDYKNGAICFNVEHCPPLVIWSFDEYLSKMRLEEESVTHV